VSFLRKLNRLMKNRNDLKMTQVLLLPSLVYVVEQATLVSLLSIDKLTEAACVAFLLPQSLLARDSMLSALYTNTRSSFSPSHGCISLKRL